MLAYLLYIVWMIWIFFYTFYMLYDPQATKTYEDYFRNKNLLVITNAAFDKLENSENDNNSTSVSIWVSVGDWLTNDLTTVWVSDGYYTMYRNLFSLWDWGITVKKIANLDADLASVYWACYKKDSILMNSYDWTLNSIKCSIDNSVYFKLQYLSDDKIYKIDIYLWPQKVFTIYK